MGHLSADKAVICRSIMNLQIRRYRTFFADTKSADILADYLPIFSADINIGRSLLAEQRNPQSPMIDEV